MDTEQRLNLEGIASIALGGYLCGQNPEAIEAAIRVYMATLSPRHARGRAPRRRSDPALPSARRPPCRET